MAREEMVVVQVKDSKVLVKKERTSACGSCPAHMFCTGDKQFVNIEADANGFNVAPGDHVIIDIPNVSGTKTALLLYTLPTILFVASLLFTSRVFSDLWGLLFAAIVVSCYYLLLRFYDNAFRKKFKPKIVALVKDSRIKDPTDDVSPH